MKDWLTDEEPAQQARREATHPKRRLRSGPEFRDNIVVGIGSALYAALLAWPIYNLAIGSGSQPKNLTLLGGMIGLMLATYAVMSNRVADQWRLPIGAVGLSLVLVCWGFGPL